MMQRGVKIIAGAGRIAGCSCPDNLVPKFLGLGVQYFHSSVGRAPARQRCVSSEDAPGGRHEEVT
jgi:hypothetical protein